MNVSKIRNILVSSAVISLVLSLVMFYILKVENSLYILYYPFEIIGRGIAKLSLISKLGNLLALCIYAIVCIIPIAVYFYKYKKGNKNSVNYMLILMSAYLFYAIYKFINPMEIGLLLQSEFYTSPESIAIGKLYLSIVFYVILVSYFILISLNYIDPEKNANKTNPLTVLQIILTVFSVVNMIEIFYFGVFDIFTELRSTAGISSAAVLLKYILFLIANIISILVMFIGIKLIGDFIEDKHSEKVVTEIEKIYKYSKVTVYLSVLSSLLINTMQIFLARNLNDVNIFLSVPFGALITAFIGIILCKYFKENNDLFEDNNSII